VSWHPRLCPAARALGARGCDARDYSILNPTAGSRRARRRMSEAIESFGIAPGSRLGVAVIAWPSTSQVSPNVDPVMAVLLLKAS
jgi:hypothetical protein